VAQTLNASLVASNAAGSGGAGGGASGASPTAGSGGAGGSGGGIAGSGAARSSINVTFNGNSAGAGGAAGDGGGGTTGAGGAGGALLNRVSGLTVVHATIDGNHAASGAAVSTGTGGTTTLKNTITTANGCAGPINTGGRSLRFGNTTCPGTTGDPKLGPLQDNGGPTRTERLGSGSAAIDKVPTFRSAGCPPHDQRDANRPTGPACDIGAVEDAPPTAVTGPAHSVGISAASLDGTMDARGLATTYRLEFGRTSAYGSATGPQSSSAVARFGVRQTLHNLRPFTTYHYRWVAQNVDGASFGADRTFTTARPSIQNASLSPTRFAVAKGSTPVVAAAGRKVRRGSKVRFRLAEAANVTLTVKRATKGVKLRRKGKRRCVTASRANVRALRRQLRKQLGSAATPRHLARAVRKAACLLYVRRGRLRRHGSAGANTVRFTGRMGRRALRLGRYRLELVAEERGVRSATRRLGFRIVSAKRKPKPKG
jgi:hypothetical protein